MQIALNEAVLAANEGEMPVGAVIVKDGKVIASAHNERNKKHDPTLHAEIVAMRQACELLLLWDGANAGEVIYNHPEGFAPSTTAVLSLKNTLCPKFATFYMVFLESIIRNNTKGMGVPHVDSSFLSNLPFFIPSVAEQTLIANHLDSKCSEIDACINEKQEQISTLESYKKSLIYEYVTGKKEIAAND